MAGVHSLLKLDIQASDFLSALGYCLLPGGQAQASARLQQRWGAAAHTLASTTLRSGFDLYMQALALPAGSEVLMSAITHPDMVEVVRQLGLVPIPLDLDAATMAPRPDLLRQALTPATRVVVVAQLFGGFVELDEVASLCAAHGLKLVEDCAQTFGAGYAGHPRADISLFSFGPLKTRTALAGALMTVREPAVRDRMAALQASYPLMGRGTFARRVLKYAAIWFLANDPRRWGLLCRAIARQGKAPNTVVRGWTKSLNGAFRIERFRVRPAVPLLRLLERRLRRGDATAWVARRSEVGLQLATRLPTLERPGARAREPLHWLFPVMVPEPARMLDQLYRGGFQAMPGLSNLDTFAPPADRPDLAPHEARRILDGVLVVPLHPTLSEADLAALSEILTAGGIPLERSDAVGSHGRSGPTL